jgi:hypothetical protein
VQKLLEPITAVLETVFNSWFGEFQGASSNGTAGASNSNLIPNEILDIIKYISLSLTNPKACPCF